MKGRRRVDVVGGADCPLLGSKCTPAMHSDIELMLECSVITADSRIWSCREVQYCSAVQCVAVRRERLRKKSDEKGGALGFEGRRTVADA